MTFSPEFDSWDYSIGVLGLLSAYLFFTIANKNYVPLVQAETNSKQLNVIAIIIAILAVVPFVILICLYFDIFTLISDLMRIVIIFPCVYLAVKSINNKHKNPFRSATKISNICVVACCFSHAYYDLFFTDLLANYVGLITIIMGTVFAASTLVILPALKNGLKTWEK